MEVIFLGGASGIGASCVAVRTGTRWLLVDAGVRMNPHEDRLPDLAFLQDKPLAAIFVTHAHADHIGALPLVQQSFPGVPIYTSRATMLLMEVMLADALQVMARRADAALEVPLYDDAAVSATLQMLRPLPLTGSVTVPELPNVTVHTARSGHVAGAMSIGFEADDGRLVISGDVSVTPQRTIPGAALIGLKHPDLLILESTYGSRLHPNRQAEEERLAQTVATGIERGGHVLIPAFALGRAQEVLRILHEAQRRGHIPEFPVWVDGLVRAVCNTYTAIPEALSKPLERQIRRGYAPFFTGMVRSVTDVRQREKIIQGAPACVVSSSGMLTGGPSAFFAARLAEHPDNSILITGYQDEEAPGRRLLNLADQGGGTLDVDGTVVQVRCHFDRYSLSAHADGGELAGMVSALKPKTVALVHGDNDARGELAQRLERIAGLEMPTDGSSLAIEPGAKKSRSARKPRRASPPRPVVALSTAGAGEGRRLTGDDLPRLWSTVTDNSGEQVVSVRELALAWYGAAADAAADAAVWEALAADQRFFVPHPDLPDMVRVQATSQVQDSATIDPQTRRVLRPGALVLLQLYGGKVQTALCLDVHHETLRVCLPASEGQRSRFPRASVLEVVGMWPAYPVSDIDAARDTLTELVKAAQQWQRQRPLRVLAAEMDPASDYALEEVWTALAVVPDDLAGRLAVALMLNAHPEAIERETALLAQEARYRRLQGAAAERAIADSEPRPDQVAILATIERHLGQPPDLYKRSVNPDTGAVTLAFHFPAIARQQYGAALAAASNEAGVPIEIAPHPHQGALTKAAHAALPADLRVLKTSLHHPRQAVALRVGGNAPAEALHHARDTFHAQTGWTLELEGAQTGSSAPPPQAPAAASRQTVDMHQAVSQVRAALGAESGCYKVSADQSARVLQVRFHFPAVAQARYADLLADLSQQTGWQVTLYPEPHQGEMEAAARRALPAGLEPVGGPSFHRTEQQTVLRCRGTAANDELHQAEHTFAETTGWRLVIQIV